MPCPCLVVKAVTSLCSVFHQLQARGCISQPECTQRAFQAWPGSCSWLAVQHCGFRETEQPAGAPCFPSPCCRVLLKPSTRHCPRIGAERQIRQSLPAQTNNGMEKMVAGSTPFNPPPMIHRVPAMCHSVPLCKACNLSVPQSPPQVGVRRPTSPKIPGLFGKRNV